MNDKIQIRKIWASGCQPDAGDDIVAASTGNDFVVRMDQRKIENAAFLVKYPSRALDLPFININGQPLHRNLTFKRCITPWIAYVSVLKSICVMTPN